MVGWQPLEGQLWSRRRRSKCLVVIRSTGRYTYRIYIDLNRGYGRKDHDCLKGRQFPSDFIDLWQDWMTAAVVKGSVVGEEDGRLDLPKSLQNSMDTSIWADCCPYATKRCRSQHSNKCICVVCNVAGYSVSFIEPECYQSSLAQSYAFPEVAPCHDLACSLCHGDDGRGVQVDVAGGE